MEPRELRLTTDEDESYTDPELQDMTARVQALFHDRRGQYGYQHWTQGATGGVSPAGKTPEGARVDPTVHPSHAAANKALKRSMRAGAEKRR
jgi:hypothetical protein